MCMKCALGEAFDNPEVAVESITIEENEDGTLTLTLSKQAFAVITMMMAVAARASGGPSLPNPSIN